MPRQAKNGQQGAGTALARLRFEAGALSISQLAAAFGIPQQQLWAVETGRAKRLLCSRVVRKLMDANVSELDAADLVGNRAAPLTISKLAKHVRKLATKEVRP